MSRKKKIAIAIGVLVAALVAALLVLGSVVYSDMPKARFEPMEGVPAVGSLSAAQCGACHPAVYAEWQQSGHARAHSDPLYQAELADQPAPFGCERCHAPLVEQRERLVTGLWVALPGFFIDRSSENPRFDKNLQAEGVTCVTCHQVDDKIVGPFGDTTAPHPTLRSDLRAVENCQRCHEQHLEILGRKLQRPIMDTVVEWEAYREAGGDKRCADCHMPQLEDPRPLTAKGKPRPATNHSLRGPWEDAFVDTGVLVKEVKLVQTGAGGRASLVLENGTGHGLPTAEPERFVTVRLEAFAQDGKLVDAAEYRVHRPVDVLRLREEPGLETTLLPREKRPVELELNQLGAATRLRLSVNYWRWDPKDPSAVHAGLDEAALLHRVFEREIIVKP